MATTYPEWSKAVKIAGEQWMLFRGHYDDATNMLKAVRGADVFPGCSELEICPQYDVVEPLHAADCRREQSCGGTTIGDTCTCGAVSAISPSREAFLAAARAALAEYRAIRDEQGSRREQTMVAVPPVKRADAATAWRGDQSMDDEDSIF